MNRWKQHVFTAARRQALVAVSLGAVACGIEGGQKDGNEGGVGVGTDAATTGATLLPTSDVANPGGHVWAAGGKAPLYALVNDGTSYSSSDTYHTYVRSAPGVAAASVTFGYSGAPAGGAAKVVVNYQAWAAQGGTGTVRIKLYNGSNLIGTGAAHTLSTSYTDFSDTFGGLSVTDANQLRTEIDFNNTAGTGSLCDTMVWVNVTPTTSTPPASGEIFHPAYPHPFVSNATGQPVLLNGFNLRQTGSKGVALAAADANAIHDAGFNMLRLAMQWPDYEPTEGNYNASVLAALDTTIARCKAAGIYVILDPFHASSGAKFPAWSVQSGDDDAASVLRGGLPYLGMLAQRYKNEPQVVAIDLVNELHISPATSERLFSTYNTLAATVRAQAPDKTVVYAPIGGDFDESLLDFSRIADKTNAIWSSHFYYAGGGGSTNGYSSSGYANQGHYVWDGTSGYPASAPADLAAHFKVTLDALKTVSLPVWVGEYGIGKGVTNHDQWFKDVTALFDANQISRTQWSYQYGEFGAVDNTDTFYPWASLLTK